MSRPLQRKVSKYLIHMNLLYYELVDLSGAITERFPSNLLKSMLRSNRNQTSSCCFTRNQWKSGKSCSNWNVAFQLTSVMYTGLRFNLSYVKIDFYWTWNRLEAFSSPIPGFLNGWELIFVGVGCTRDAFWWILLRNTGCMSAYQWMSSGKFTTGASRHSSQYVSIIPFP